MVASGSVGNVDAFSICWEALENATMKSVSY